MQSTFSTHRPAFTILLVEDELASIDILQRAAKASFPEARLVPITTFEQAVLYLFSLAGNGPQLILLDVFLQGSRTGLDFLQLLKADSQGKLVPVIVLSASADPAHCKEAYQRGASTYVVKPYSFQGWKAFMAQLRLYWYETATLPPTYFERINTLDRK